MTCPTCNDTFGGAVRAKRRRAEAKALSLTAPLAGQVRRGEKAETRRPMRVQPAHPPAHFDGHWFEPHSGAGPALELSAPYAPGDVLWVREPALCVDLGRPRGLYPRTVTVEYVADGEQRTLALPERLAEPVVGHRFANGIFREAARTFLRVIDVRPEQLQDITEDGLAREGLAFGQECCGSWVGDYNTGPECCGCPVPDIAGARGDFAALWDGIYAGRGLGWDENPWVWVIRFERLEVSS